MTLAEHRADMESCCRCSACKFIPLEKVTGYARVNVCPAVSRFEFHSYSAGGRMGFGLGLIHGRVDYTARTKEVIYNCHLCGACDVSCKYAMEFEVIEPLYAMREECVKHGQIIPVWDQLVGGLGRGAPLVADVETEALDWHRDLPARDLARDSGAVLYHAGCLARHTKAAGEAAALAVALLQRAGVDVGIDKQDETCCGGRAYEMGYREEALAQARRRVARFRELGVKQLVTGCAHCYQYFKVLYPKLGVEHGLEVRHASEVLGDLVAQGLLRPTRPLDMVVTYHDPCHLGRLSEPWIPWQGVQRMRHMRVYDPPRVLRRGTHGVYEPPRELLRSLPGVRLVEMDRIKEYAWCCGAGGGVRESNPAFAHWTARERMAEAQATGAEAVVTACPHCVRNLAESTGRAVAEGRGAAAEGHGSTAEGRGSTARGLPVYDLVHLLSEAVGESL